MGRVVKGTVRSAFSVTAALLVVFRSIFPGQDFYRSEPFLVGFLGYKASYPYY